MKILNLFKNAEGISGLADKSYRDIPAVSQTAIKHLINSPAHYKAYQEEIKEETDAMRLGTATHIAVFQPSLFDSHVVMAPKFDRRKTEDKVAFAKFQEQNVGKILLSQDDYDRCLGMAEAVRGNPTFIKLTECGEPEYSITAETVAEGIKVKGRLDWVDFKNRVIVDLKSIGETASFRAINKTIHKRGYDIQNAMYNQLLTALIADSDFRFVFAFCESNKPHGVRFVEINKSNLWFETMPRISSAFASLKQAYDSGVYENYSNKISVIDIG